MPLILQIFAFIGSLFGVIAVIVYFLSKMVYLRLNSEADKLVRRMELTSLVLIISAIVLLIIVVLLNAVQYWIQFLL